MYVYLSLLTLTTFLSTLSHISFSHNISSFYNDLAVILMYNVQYASKKSCRFLVFNAVAMVQPSFFNSRTTVEGVVITTLTALKTTVSGFAGRAHTENNGC